MNGCYPSIGKISLVVLILLVFDSCAGFCEKPSMWIGRKIVGDDKKALGFHSRHSHQLFSPLSLMEPSARKRIQPPTLLRDGILNGVEDTSVGTPAVSVSFSASSTATSSTTIPTTTSVGKNNNSTVERVLLYPFCQDLIALADQRPPIPSADFSAPAAIISAGSSYTRLWTAGTWERHGAPPHVRYWKHVRTWSQSTSAHKILPAVALSTVYSLCMALFLKYAKIRSFHIGTSVIKGSSAAMAALSAPLALLLTLRANASLGRLNEARLSWGRLILRGRNLAALLRVYVLPFHPAEAILAARYLSVLGWSMKAYVRNESYKTQRQVYNIMLGPQETQWLLAQEALPPPLAILLRVRQIVADVSLNNDNPNFFVPHSAMDKAIDDLDSVLGCCQRLLTSPIPPTYSRHLSRIMVMYLCLLPFAFVAGGTPSFGTAVASALVSYVIIGIDEIGMEMENPFPLLPLQQLASNLQNVVGQQLLV